LPKLLKEVEKLIANLERLEKPESRGDRRRMIQSTIDLARAVAGHRALIDLAAVKPWYRRKTLWAGFMLAGVGTGELLAGEDCHSALAHLLQGLGLMALRQAIAGVSSR